MKVDRLYSFSNKRQIWRIIPAGRNIIIEEREPLKKEVFFSCIKMDDGKILFRDFQLDEKFWVGVEAVHNGIIFFHKYAKPDMPGHKEIIAVDLNTLDLLWNTAEYSFLFASENKIYAYINTFEGRKYIVLDYRTGEIINELPEQGLDINELRFKSYDNEFFEDSWFPELCSKDDPVLRIIASDTDKQIAGRVECIKYNNHYFMSYHIEDSRGVLKNLFCIVEILQENIIFKEVLNQKTEKFIPETFFIKGNRLYLIREKSVLEVYLIN